MRPSKGAHFTDPFDRQADAGFAAAECYEVTDFAIDADGWEDKGSRAETRRRVRRRRARDSEMVSIMGRRPISAMLGCLFYECGASLRGYGRDWYFGADSVPDPLLRTAASTECSGSPGSRCRPWAARSPEVSALYIVLDNSNFCRGSSRGRLSSVSTDSDELLRVAPRGGRV